MLQRLWLCRASDTVFRREIDSQRQWVMEHAMVIVSPLRRSVGVIVQTGNRMPYVNYVLANTRMFNLELYTHKTQKLTLLHLFTHLFRDEIFLILQNKKQTNKQNRKNTYGVHSINELTERI